MTMKWPKPILDVKIGNLIIPAIVGMGCTQSIVKGDLISPQARAPEIPVNMVYIHGASYTYERTRL